MNVNAPQWFWAILALFLLTKVITGLTWAMQRIF